MIWGIESHVKIRMIQQVRSRCNATTNGGKKFSRMGGMGCSAGDEHSACTHSLLLVRLYRRNLETEHLLDNIPRLDPFPKSQVFIISVSEFVKQCILCAGF